MAAQDRTITRKRIEIKQAGDEDDDMLPYPHQTWGVTIDPIRILSGEIPVSVQYAPLSWLILEAGTGVTTKHYLYSALDFDYGYFSSSEVANSDVNIKPMLTLAVKLFPTADVFDDGSYIGLEYRYRNYSRDVEFTPSTSADYILTESKVFKDLGFLYGYQYATDVDNLFIDYYVGVSLRFVENTYIGEDYNSPSGTPEFKLGYYENQTFGFLGGIKIGYNFK